MAECPHPLDREDWPAWLRLSKEAGICIQGMYIVKCMTHCSNARKLYTSGFKQRAVTRYWAVHTHTIIHTYTHIYIYIHTHTYICVKYSAYFIKITS